MEGARHAARHRQAEEIEPVVVARGILKDLRRHQRIPIDVGVEYTFFIAHRAREILARWAYDRRAAPLAGHVIAMQLRDRQFVEHLLINDAYRVDDEYFHLIG